MKMLPSKSLAIMRAGGVVSCFKLNLADPRSVQIAALSGFDCVWTDMEHVPNNSKDIEMQILAAKACGTDSIVRVSRGGYSDYIKPLEADATGIMVPHIMSLADAGRVVSMTRFHPIGMRPVDGGNADGAFCKVDFKDYISQANSERMVIIQIEDPEPLAEIDEIASLEGIDMLFFGPGDFSQAVGTPGDFSNPRIAEARKRVAEAAKRHGKFAGTVGSIDNLKELTGMGYQFVSVGADVVGLGTYCEGIVADFRKIING